MIHFYILNDNYVNIAYFRDSDLRGGSFALPYELSSYKKFMFNYGGRPWPEFLNDHGGYKHLVSTSNNYTPTQFMQDHPELFL